jgi:hypothetical protein
MIDLASPRVDAPSSLLRIRDDLKMDLFGRSFFLVRKLASPEEQKRG